MSHEQNPSGWEPPFPQLRKGQFAFYQALLINQKVRYGIQLPTGYGKSWCAAIAFATLREQDRINRCLIVVPQTQQLNQYLDDFPQDLHDLNIPVRGVTWCENVRAIREHHRNEKDIFLTTVQGIASDASYYADLMGQGRWVVIADEFHHYAHENTWGAALRNLRYDVIVGMSATPIRADGRLTILDDDCDVTVTIEQARDEQAIRIIQAKVSDYFLDITMEDTQEFKRITLGNLEEELQSLPITEWEAQKKIRYNSKYLSTILLDAITTLNLKNVSHPGQHQMLVFAMSCKHAQHVTDILNALTQDKTFAQWVGEGPNGRATKDNERIIQTFKNNEFSCLVQVNKAGEGFNNKRCSVGVFLNLIGDTPMARQQIGRFMRRNAPDPKKNPPNPGIPEYRDDYATIFVSQDAKILGLLRKYEEATHADQEERFLLDDDTASCEACNLRLFHIPPLFNIDMEFKDQEVVWPYGSPEASVDAYRDKHPLFATASQAELIQAMRTVLAEQQQSKKVSEKDRMDDVKKHVGAAVSALATNVLRLRFGQSFEKSMLGDVIRLVHGGWVRTSGIRHAEMTHQEFVTKYQWIVDVSETLIRTKEIPAWLLI